MKQDKDELISLQYRMEKSDVKQQKLETRLASVSKALHKSNRSKNVLLLLFILLLLSTFAGFYYLSSSSGFNLIGNANNMSPEDENIRSVNDSLKMELAKLRSDIEEYKKAALAITDTSGLALNDSLQVSEKDSTKIKYERKYGYVDRAYESNGAKFIEVDYAEYFEGKKAVEMAREYGTAEYDIDEKGDTLYFLYNNYYIHNRNNNKVILELHERANIRLNRINQISSGFSLKAFNKIIKEDKPLLVLATDNGVVYRITEQKLK